MNKKPKSHRETYFRFPVFADYTVIIVLTEDISGSAAYLADRDNFIYPSMLADCQACHIQPVGRGHSYVVLAPDVAVRTIAHESWHVVHGLMLFTGVNLEDEFIAYHLGHIVEQVRDFQIKCSTPRRKNANSGRARQKAGAGRARRSRGDSPES